MDHKRRVNSENIIIRLDNPSKQTPVRRRKKDNTNETILVVFGCLLFCAALGYALANEYYHRRTLDRTNRIRINDNDITELDSHREEIRDEYVDQLTAHFKSKHIKIIPGNFNACQRNGWHYACIDSQRKIMGVMQWEISSIATVLVNNDIKLDVEEEVDTLLVYKRFLSLVGVRYHNRREFRKRYYNFRDNKKRIETHNAKPYKMYIMSYTSYADQSEDDIEGFSGMFIGSSTQTNHGGYKLDELNISGSSQVGKEEDIFDWRNNGVVKDTIDQGSCGSCWAISAADAISIYHFINYKSDKKFSSQQLLDCTSKRYNCSGGSLYYTILYATKNLLCDEDEYPYKGVQGTCDSRKCKHEVSTKGIKKLRNKNIREHLVEHGPIATSFTISRDFWFYSSGIFNGSCTGLISHSIVIVGYGYDSHHKTKYWIVKNSWGSSWGEGGFFRIVDDIVENGSSTEYYCSIRTYAYGLEADKSASTL